MFSFQQHVRGFLNSPSLKGLIHSVTDFKLEKLAKIPSYEFPPNPRLGKRVEFILKQLLLNGQNYTLLGDNIVLKNKKRTIGEVDFLLQQSNVNIHLELAFKFYLFDETLASNFVEQWIGPNRKDFLFHKINHLEHHQLKITHSPEFKDYQNICGSNIYYSPALLFKAQLFLPYLKKVNIPPNFSQCICGEWMNFKHFESYDDAFLFFIPNKQDWVVEPKENNVWYIKQKAIKIIIACHERKFSPLVWIKKEGLFKKIFVVWW